MSTKIKLTVLKQPSPHDPSVPITRLLVGVAFRTYNGLTKSYRAIVDTGAPTSLLPFSVWRPCRALKLRETVISGIVARKECELPVIEAAVACMLSDDQSALPEMVIRAHLAPHDNVPLLIGFGGILDRVILHCSVPMGTAYLELKE
ncbi:MAG TPA: hypothetical protein EYP49_12715 [Anaerolineae bacterium]|nr:hypothetical protein [Anaerolineae bacterium]